MRRITPTLLSTTVSGAKGIGARKSFQDTINNLEAVYGQGGIGAVKHPDESMFGQAKIFKSKNVTKEDLPDLSLLDKKHRKRWRKMISKVEKRDQKYRQRRAKRKMARNSHQKKFRAMIKGPKRYKGQCEIKRKVRTKVKGYKRRKSGTRRQVTCVSGYYRDILKCIG